MARKNVSSIYFDGSFDCFTSIRKFVGDANIEFIHIDGKPKYSRINIKNDLCSVYVVANQTITKDEHGKFSVKKRRAKRGYAGDL